MAKDVTEDVEEEADEVKDDTYKEVVEESAAHMKIGLVYHMSLVTLKVQSGTHSQTRQEKGYWLIKRYGPPVPSVPKKRKTIG